MNKVLNIAISLILVVMLLSVPAMADDAQLQADALVKNMTVLNGNYDDGDSPVGNTGDANDPGLFEIEPDPLGDAARGNVGHFIKHSELTIVMANKNKVYVDFDFNFGSDTTNFSLGVRDGTTKGVTYCWSIKPGSSNGASIELNKWYSAKCVIDYVNKKQNITILDSEGTVLAGPTEVNLKFTGTNPSHLRFRSYTTSSVYIDNLVVKEDVAWPELDSLAGSEGEAVPVYTNNKLVLNMTQEMKTVTPADISLVNNITGDEIPANEVTVSGKQITIIPSKVLQSSTKYTLTLYGTAVGKYGSYPIEDEYSVDFITSARDFDLTDAQFTPNGNKLTAVASFVNNTDEEKIPVVMMSAYNSEGRITAISYVSVNVPSDGNIYQSDSLEITVPDGGYARLTAIGSFDDTAPVNNNIYTFRY